jgi:hypothetical protein
VGSLDGCGIDANLTISKPAEIVRPQPAPRWISRLLHFTPKANLGWRPRMAGSTFATAKPLIWIETWSRKRCTARWTDASGGRLGAHIEPPFDVLCLRRLQPHGGFRVPNYSIAKPQIPYGGYA